MDFDATKPYRSFFKKIKAPMAANSNVDVIVSRSPMVLGSGKRSSRSNEEQPVNQSLPLEN